MVEWSKMKTTSDEIRNMPAGREMDILIARHVLELGNYVIDNFDDYRDMNFSTNIKHAFDVLEKFSHAKLSKYECGKEWACYLGATAGKADTAPLAICRAALLVVEEHTRGQED